jgi:hypothetical protein
LNRLAWLETEFAELLDDAIKRAGGIDLFAILEQALHYGRRWPQQQAKGCFVALHEHHRTVPSWTVAHQIRQRRECCVLSHNNELFSLPPAMAVCKAIMKAAENVIGSSVETCMGANGVEFWHQGQRFGARNGSLPLCSRYMESISTAALSLMPTL